MIIPMSFSKKGSIINRLIFPAPPSSYKISSFPPNTLLWLPMEGQMEVRVPCAIVHRPGAEFLVIFYHGNGDDLGGAYKFLRALSEYLASLGVFLSFLIVEYPGYGLFAGKANEEGVHKAAQTAFHWARDVAQWPMQNIWLWGISIGTGPATQIASQHECGALVLTAAYESIRAVVKHLLGNTAQYLVSERFDNLSKIRHVECPVMFIHGEEDKLIPCSQTLQLFEHTKSQVKMLFIADGVGHTNFNMERDIVHPFLQFVTRIKDERLSEGLVVEPPFFIELTPEILQPPSILPSTLHLDPRQKSSWTSMLNPFGLFGRRKSGSEEHKAELPVASPVQVSEDLMSQLVGMGFDPRRSAQVLASTNNDIASALEILLS